MALGILGVPIPDEALMTYLGYVINSGKLNYSYAFILSFLGSLTGMTLSYLIGKGILSRFEHKFEERFNLKEKRINLEKILARFGNIIIVFGYYFPGIRHLVAYTCGMLKMNYVKFLIYSSIGAFIWVNSFILLGYYLGDDWKKILYFSLHYKNVIAITAIAVLVMLICYYIKKQVKDNNTG
ncbi:DedA family protein [Pelotomaculum isophthalicicum JI]|uniref:DedA family protein n=1 Tax=Pelotomaculum isophthalicicum JI TaxID=947010 RepID=A0A9X4H126_9FIRM|nr:DedA family protein [Pelotomaculum isophthalicicum]MDF9407725.1 DedA family protein [Pelotomaculum isophthalicicum JI]